MNSPLAWTFSWLTGAALGVTFFGGLWWTVAKGLSCDRPAVWFIGSLLLRTSVALGGFYWVARGQWQRLLFCLCGFMAARLVVTRYVRAMANPAKNRTDRPVGKANRAA